MRLKEKSTVEVKEMMSNINNKVSQSKDEQEALLAKVKSYAVKTEATAVAKAGYVDFSKSVEDQQQLDGMDEHDRDVLILPTPCYVCTKMGSVQMCTSSIPYFKEIIIMAFVCDHCGYRNSEIKEGGGIGEKAKRITFSVTDPDDLCRDIFKSDTSKFTIKELDFDMESGSMGSLYTTVEGLVGKLIEELEKNNPFGQGDSKTDN
jgi:zinc finger protein